MAGHLHIPGPYWLGPAPPFPNGLLACVPPPAFPQHERRCVFWRGGLGYAPGWRIVVTHPYDNFPEIWWRCTGMGWFLEWVPLPPPLPAPLPQRTPGFHWESVRAARCVRVSPSTLRACFRISPMRQSPELSILALPLNERPNRPRRWQEPRDHRRIGRIAPY